MTDVVDWKIWITFLAAVVVLFIPMEYWGGRSMGSILWGNWQRRKKTFSLIASLCGIALVIAGFSWLDFVLWALPAASFEMQTGPALLLWGGGGICFAAALATWIWRAVRSARS
jgi:hypothetical protein